jgi:hypothetical protein
LVGETEVLLQEIKIRHVEWDINGLNISEIPIPLSDPYEQPKKSSDSGTCCKIGVVICVILIVGMIIIAMVFMGGFLSVFGGITTGGGSTYQTRSLLSSTGQDINISPAYYYNDFSLSTSDVQTTTSPDVYFVINVEDTGSDAVSVTIHFAIYKINQTTFESIPTWGGLDSYLVEEGDYTTACSSYFDINNYASTYVWIIWFEATSKTSVWTVDITLTLRYNWNL